MICRLCCLRAGCCEFEFECCEASGACISVCGGSSCMGDAAVTLCCRLTTRVITGCMDAAMQCRGRWSRNTQHVAQSACRAEKDAAEPSNSARAAALSWVTTSKQV